MSPARRGERRRVGSLRRHSAARVGEWRARLRRRHRERLLHGLLMALPAVAGLQLHCSRLLCVSLFAQCQHDACVCQCRLGLAICCRDRRGGSERPFLSACFWRGRQYAAARAWTRVGLCELGSWLHEHESDGMRVTACGSVAVRPSVRARASRRRAPRRGGGTLGVGPKRSKTCYVYAEWL